MNRYKRQDQIRWILQILVWGGFWMLSPMLADNFPENTHSLQRSGFLAITTATLVALNVLFLFPSFYQKRRFWIFFASGIFLIILYTTGLEWAFREVLGPNPNRPDPASFPRGMSPRGPGDGTFRTVTRLIPFLLVFLGSAAIEISVHAQRQAQESIELKNEKLASEMKWLRWQMNPHFLFNALNNIYSLTVIKSDKAPENLMALSEMMRYMLYEGSKDRVPLSKEIDYLHRYIDLQQLKDSTGLNIQIDLAPVPSHLEIAPQLLLPFVENAFKHSNIEDLEKGWITIALKQEGTTIQFEVKNSIPERRSPKDQQGGLGLANVKRLLTLSYPEKHSLTIEETDQQYSVCLELTLR